MQGHCVEESAIREDGVSIVGICAPPSAIEDGTRLHLRIRQIGIAMICHFGANADASD
jgi:hypothetical protein